jgi:hypothetical protein
MTVAFIVFPPKYQRPLEFQQEDMKRMKDKKGT